MLQSQTPGQSPPPWPECIHRREKCVFWSPSLLESKTKSQKLKMAPPLGTPELQKELADIARRIVENGKGEETPLRNPINPLRLPKDLF